MTKINIEDISIETWTKSFSVQAYGIRMTHIPTGLAVFRDPVYTSKLSSAKEELLEWLTELVAKNTKTSVADTQLKVGMTSDHKQK